MSEDNKTLKKFTMTACTVKQWLHNEEEVFTVYASNINKAEEKLGLLFSQEQGSVYMLFSFRVDNVEILKTTVLE